MSNAIINITYFINEFSASFPAGVTGSLALCSLRMEMSSLHRSQPASLRTLHFAHCGRKWVLCIVLSQRH